MGIRLNALTCLASSFMMLSTISGAQQIAFSTGDLVFKGDLRFRHEQISQEGAKQRDRERIRARMSDTATVDPKVNFIFGVASGSNNDPISSNQDMGADSPTSRFGSTRRTSTGRLRSAA